GLQVIFHGCTIPRGWERMYPNYVASEAVLASENVFFNEGVRHHEKREPRFFRWGLIHVQRIPSI
ncbi:MAG: glycoside hydrolase family 97 catalytic domain-containing protein, partial [Treponema sp.]|nr:glycoside hydrolase family 97 catalytic domain-containing protein [Treponema sp.]